MSYTLGDLISFSCSRATNIPPCSSHYKSHGARVCARVRKVEIRHSEKVNAGLDKWVEVIQTGGKDSD